MVPMRPEDVKKSCRFDSVDVVLTAARGTESESLENIESK